MKKILTAVLLLVLSIIAIAKDIPPCLEEWENYVSVNTKTQKVIKDYDPKYDELRAVVAGTKWIEERLGKNGEIVTKNYLSINSSGCVGKYDLQDINGNYESIKGALEITRAEHDGRIYIGTLTDVTTSFSLCISGSENEAKSRSAIENCNDWSDKYRLRYIGPN